MCIGCVMPMLEPGTEIGITDETRADLIEYFKGKSAN